RESSAADLALDRRPPTRRSGAALEALRKASHVSPAAPVPKAARCSGLVSRRAVWGNLGRFYIRPVNAISEKSRISAPSAPPCGVVKEWRRIFADLSRSNVFCEKRPVRSLPP